MGTARWEKPTGLKGVDESMHGVHYLNGVLGLVLVVFAVLQVGSEGGVWWASVYIWGAFLAFLTLKLQLNLWTVRFLAVVTTAAMFFYFAAFFRLAPNLHEEWYRGADAIEALGLLFAAFSMIPVLSEFSCRMKADCVEERGDAPLFSREQHPTPVPQIHK